MAKKFEFAAVDSKMATEDDPESALLCSSIGLEPEGEGVYDLKKTTSFKAGEILRNENGQYSFLCVYCDATTEGCQEIINHIDSHFETNGLIDLGIKMTAKSEFISCAVPADVNMINESEADIVNNDSFYDLNDEASEPELFNFSGDLKTKFECQENFTGVGFDDYNLLHTTSPNVTRPAVMQTKTETQTTRLSKEYKMICTISESKTTSYSTLTHTSPVVRTIKSETIGLEPKLNEQSEITPTNSTYKHKIIDASAARALIESWAKKRETPRPKIVKYSNLPKNSFKIDGSKTSSTVCLTQQLSEEKTENRKNNIKAKCYQCASEPTIINQSDPRPHKCYECKEWLSNHVQFKTHFKEVHDLDADDFAVQSKCTEFSCYVCKKDLPVRAYLNNHLKMHNEKILLHLCSTCGLRFRTNSILTQHAKIHDGKTFKCDKCEKVFNLHHRLVKHLWCHRTELDYICDLCSKGFKLRKYLKRHMAVHSKVKLHCRFCDATFTFSSCRRVHEKSRHNVV